MLRKRNRIISSMCCFSLLLSCVSYAPVSFASEVNTPTVDTISVDSQDQSSVENQDTPDLEQQRSITTQFISNEIVELSLLDSADLSDSAIVQFHVWNVTQNKEDAVIYQAAKDESEQWICQFKLSDHLKAGTYNVEAVLLENDKPTLLADTSFDVNPAYSGTVSIINQDDNAGSFQIKVTDIDSTFGVSKVQIPVWASINGQNDIIWYNATKADDGWYANVSYLDHQCELGSYNIHVYLEDLTGSLHFVTHTSTDLGADNALSASVITSDDQSEFKISLNNYFDNSDTLVQFAVWGNDNGQNDLRWYPANKISTGTYEATVKVSDHMEVDNYSIHIYAFKSTGPKLITHTTTQIEGISLSSPVSILDKKDDYGTFRVSIPEISCPSEITNVMVPIWSEHNGQDDIIWYSAKKDADQTWYVDVDLANHQFDLGKYFIHVYAYDQRQFTKLLDHTEVSFESITNRTYASSKISNDYSTVTITVHNLPNVTSVQIPVWGNTNGQNDIVWYSAQKVDETTWQTNVDLKNHLELGTYSVHVYTKNDDSSLAFCTNTVFTVNRLPDNILVFSNQDNTYGTVTAKLINPNASDSIKSVRFAVWTDANGQDDIVWYNGTHTNNEWHLQIDSTNHNYESGLYYVHVYATTNTNASAFLAASNVNITRTIRRIYQNPAGYYQIKDKITLSGGDYNVYYGCEGLKVKKIVRYFGINDGIGMNKAIFGPRTKSAVLSFQRSNGLPATGVVDLATWRKMGFSDSEWNSLGAWVHPLYVKESSTRAEHIEAMIKAAYEYLGDPYVIGASGAPGAQYGLDCSGFAMQALYAAGLDMETINPVTHAQPGHEYESRNMWASDKFLHIPYASRQRGDLIFYQDSAGVINHVAIYLGNNTIIDSSCIHNKVEIATIGSRGSIKGVVRPFID